MAITDPRGRWLAIDKWNRFGPSFDGDSSGVQDRMLASAALVAEQLGNWGYPVYIVGEPCSGQCVQQSAAHDDDVDSAFLVVGNRIHARALSSSGNSSTGLHGGSAQSPP